MQNLYVIVGSLRKESINRKLAVALEPLLTGLFHVAYCDLAAVPLYNQDEESAMPAGVVCMKDGIAKADAVLFFTPEYNRSIPGVLKNALDWASRPYGKSAWVGKVAGIAGVSPGPVGTCAAQGQLRDMLTMLGMHLVARPELYLSLANTPDLFAQDGSLGREDTKAFLRKYLESLAEFAHKVKG